MEGPKLFQVVDTDSAMKMLTFGTKLSGKNFFNASGNSQKNGVKRIKIEPIEKISVPKKRKIEVKNDDLTPKKRPFALLNGLDSNSDDKKPKKKKKLMTEEKEAQLNQEKINEFRNLHKISVVGRRIPTPISSFDELGGLGVKEDLIKNIKGCRFKDPTPIQMQAIPILLEGRQLLACAPTGSGKTLAFLLPIIHHLNTPKKLGFRAIILSPTRELAKQTYRECIRLSEGRDLRIHMISKIKQSMDKYGPKSSGKFDILITTPKRLIFLLNQEPAAINLSNVEFLVIDEADKLFEDGTRGFRDQLDQISKNCTHEKLKTAMFSATNTPVVTKWCRHNLKGLINVTIGHRNAATDLVDQRLVYTGSEGGKLPAFREIIRKGMAPPVLIFAESKMRAQELFNELIYDGINVGVIHADKTQLQRDNTVRAFREGKIWVLITTELLSRGIDFKGVNLVVNYDFPPSAISYIHRIGRTGRAGHRGKAVTFYTDSDTPNVKAIATIVKNSGGEVSDHLLARKKLSKRDKKKMEMERPKRDSISTIPKFKKRRERSEKTIQNEDKKPAKIQKSKENSTKKPKKISKPSKSEYVKMKKLGKSK